MKIVHFSHVLTRCSICRSEIGLVYRKEVTHGQGPFVCRMMERPPAIQDSDPPGPVQIFCRFVFREMVTTAPRPTCYRLIYPGGFISSVKASTDLRDVPVGDTRTGLSWLPKVPTSPFTLDGAGLGVDDRQF